MNWIFYLALGGWGLMFLFHCFCAVFACLHYKFNFKNKFALKLFDLIKTY